MTLLIKNVKIVMPQDNSVQHGDILIENETIIKCGGVIEDEADKIIIGDGLTALPGLVDMHVHLREPGQTYKEDIISGCQAAASGGVTSIAAMPNTIPAADNAETIKYILQKSLKADARVFPVGAVTVSLKSERLTDFKELKAAGAVAFTDDGKPVSSAALMREALYEAKRQSSIVLSHSEDLSLAKGIMNEGEISRKLEVCGTPNAAEDVSVAREAALCAETGCPMHICHVSSKTALAIIRAAKRDCVPITCETAPHYFTYTENKLLSRDADYRMNPPLRREEDRMAVIAAIADGTIDAIATDHAPHSSEEKADFIKAPNGVVGMQMSLAASYTALVKTGLIDIISLAKLMSLNPAKILKLPFGKLEIGAAADLLLFDENKSWTVEPENLMGKSHNTAFKGERLYGKVMMTVCRGNIVYNQL